MRARRAAIRWALSIALLSPVGSPAIASPSAEAQLFEAIAHDPSFKVRMQAIRVLAKRIIGQKHAASPEALVAIGQAASADESYLVRGLACFSLGQLADGRARTALERARKDEHPFVREQAEQALRQLPTTAPEPGMAVAALPLPDREGRESGPSNVQPTSPETRSLILSVEQATAPAMGRDLLDRLKAGMEERIRQQAGSGFVLGGNGAGHGFHLAGSIADRRLEQTGDGRSRISLVVRVTISTWPENHLRHVVTARATAETAASNEAGKSRLEQRVLEAAVKQAVDDALAEISRE